MLGAALALSMCGVLVNASAGGEAALGIPRWAVQLAWALLGAGAATAALLFDHRRLAGAAPFLYAAALVLLAAVLVIPGGGGEARRWLTLGPVNLQPAEPAKLAFVLAGAAYLARREEKPGPRRVLTLALLALVPTALVAVQPDLGTAFVFVPLTLALLYWGGVPGWKMLCLLAPLAAALAAFTEAPDWVAGAVDPSLLDSPVGAVFRPWWWLGMGALAAAWLIGRRRKEPFFGFLLLAAGAASVVLPLGWNLLKAYQQRRVLMFLDPTADPKGAGYNLIQSRIAVGSGGVWGKGFGQGTQGQLAFLPERHTDFAFSVWAEEWGLVGSLVVILLFALLLGRMLRAAGRAADRFGSLAVYGATVVLAFHAVFNVGMCLGLFPVAGLPLPFLSYGGSFALVSWLAVGLAAGVERRARLSIF
ncbi:MAG: rod shape-determining protein RodA [Candidatus Coatesbacteria bacterium RBG_13_66_14]|uniref:Rod shape-determining protein RodA n=1 Tax=Candidatus Coatesbacteria bacterium RBG_13_66_14 TaxID=1817816 RepID=A0A1F5EW80_9BACT|nr:MAG: rod shape-determining protein RodA [Candidatus Coatesbacteria bacterium RBG_13_66_14]